MVSDHSQLVFEISPRNGEISFIDRGFDESCCKKKNTINFFHPDLSCATHN